MQMPKLKHLNILGGMLVYSTFAAVLGLIAINQSLFSPKTNQPTSYSAPTVLGVSTTEETQESETELYTKGGWIVTTEETRLPEDVVITPDPSYNSSEREFRGL